MGRPPKRESDRTIQTGFRLPPDILKRVDAEVARMTTDTGAELSRSQVVVSLLRQALDARDKSRGGK